jgi:hypothetical protein
MYGVGCLSGCEHSSEDQHQGGAQSPQLGASCLTPINFDLSFFLAHLSLESVSGDLFEKKVQNKISIS